MTRYECRVLGVDLCRQEHIVHHSVETIKLKLSPLQGVPCSLLLQPQKNNGPMLRIRSRICIISTVQRRSSHWKKIFKWSVSKSLHYPYCRAEPSASCRGRMKITLLFVLLGIHYTVSCISQKRYFLCIWCGFLYSAQCNVFNQWWWWHYSSRWRYSVKLPVKFCRLLIFSAHICTLNKEMEYQ